MPAQIATIVYVAVIVGCFMLDRDQRARTSWALWIPIIWLSLACSRSVGQWLQLQTSMNLSDQYMEGSPFDRLVYMGLLGLGLIVIAYRRKRLARVLGANGPIVLFFIYCAVSLLWSDFPDIAFKRWIKAIGDLVITIVVLSDREPTAAIKRLLARTGFILIPLSVLFIKYYPQLGRSYGFWDGVAYYTGVTMNKNTLGVICLFFGLGSLWRIIIAYQSEEGSGRRRHLIAHGIIVAMALWLFWMANSMTSLSCFLMTGGLLLAINFRAVVRRPASVHLLTAAIVLISFAVLFLGFSPGALKTMGRNPTLTERTAIWALVIPMTPNSVVGAGFESFWLGPRLQQIWRLYTMGLAEAHNGYVEIYVNLGWMGVALLALVIVTGYRAVVAAYRRDPQAGSLGLAFFVAGIVYNFTEAAFFRMMAPAWIFFLLGTTSASAISNRKIKSSEPNRLQHHASQPLVENLISTEECAAHRFRSVASQLL